jgi:iron-sulfur cluster assembly protein
MSATMIQITEQAAREIKRIASERGTLEGGLRVGVKGGGCSGLSYVMDWAARPNTNDKLFEEQGARVVIDPKSFVFLDGLTISWKNTLQEKGFQLENPNVKKSCGCGTSFSV